MPLIIRTFWKYTKWRKISFTLLAEDRNDLEIGYYQVDSGSLGGCQIGKTITILLPFKSVGLVGNVNHNVFLHGFEISPQPYTSSKSSPF